MNFTNKVVVPNSVTRLDGPQVQYLESASLMLSFPEIAQTSSPAAPTGTLRIARMVSFVPNAELMMVNSLHIFNNERTFIKFDNFVDVAAAMVSNGVPFNIPNVSKKLEFGRFGPSISIPAQNVIVPISYAMNHVKFKSLPYSSAETLMLNFALTDLSRLFHVVDIYYDTTGGMTGDVPDVVADQKLYAAIKNNPYDPDFVFHLLMTELGAVTANFTFAQIDPAVAFNFSSAQIECYLQILNTPVQIATSPYMHITPAVRKTELIAGEHEFIIDSGQDPITAISIVFLTEANRDLHDYWNTRPDSRIDWADGAITSPVANFLFRNEYPEVDTPDYQIQFKLNRTDILLDRPDNGAVTKVWQIHRQILTPYTDFFWYETSERPYSTMPGAPLVLPPACVMDLRLKYRLPNGATPIDVIVILHKMIDLTA